MSTYYLSMGVDCRGLDQKGASDKVWDLIDHFPVRMRMFTIEEPRVRWEGSPANVHISGIRRGRWDGHYEVMMGFDIDFEFDSQAEVRISATWHKAGQSGGPFFGGHICSIKPFW